MLKLATAPLLAAQERMFDEYEVRYESYKQDLAKYEETEQGDEPTAPKMERLVVGDATVEGLAPILLDNPNGVIQICDEASGFVARLNQYKNGAGGDHQFYLEAWAANPIVTDR
jgi:hypothetical protein